MSETKAAFAEGTIPTLKKILYVTWDILAKGTYSFQTFIQEEFVGKTSYQRK